MHLYGSLASPFVQRVLMTARAKGHELELRFPPGGGMASDEFRTISPMGRIPVLALDNGEHLCESSAIADYLDAALDGPALLPTDPLARARVRELEALILGEVAVGARPLMVHRVFRMADSADIVTAANAQVAQGLDALARLIGDGEGPITAADCALVPVLTLAQIVEPMTGLWAMVAERPAVAAYYARRCEDPVAKRSAEEMKAGFAQIMARQAAPAPAEA